MSPETSLRAAGPAHEAVSAPASTRSDEPESDLPTAAIDRDELTARLTGPPWRAGGISPKGATPYVVGEAGHASTTVVSVPDPLFPEHHDTVLGEALFRTIDGAGPDTHLRAASVRGLKNRHEGVVRQDDYCYRQTVDGRRVVVAVTDGVGQGRYSHEAAGVAARQACEVVCGWLRAHDPVSIRWDEVFKIVSDAIVTRGRGVLRRRGDLFEGLDARGLAPRMSTTLVIGVIDLRPDPDGGRRVVLVRVGDSTAWVRQADGTWVSPFPVKNEGAAIASAAVTALPYVTALEPPVEVRIAPGEMIALMTDGVGDPLMDGRNDFGHFLAEVWASPPSLLQFAAQVDFARVTFDDDRTAVAVWPG